MWWWWVFACKKKDPPPPVEPPAVQAPAPPAGVDAVLRALSAHDGAPDCAALGALAPDPAAALGWIAEYTELPPVAPMRAARCLLVAHPAAAEPAVTRWMTDPRSEGYVRVVIDAWAEVPPDLAVRLAAAGLAGPHAELVRASLRAAAAPELRALAP